MAFSDQQPLLPPTQTPFLADNGELSREWRRYFDDHFRWLINFQVAFNALDARVTTLEATATDHETRLVAGGL